MASNTSFNRRQFLKATGMLAAGAALAACAPAAAPADETAPGGAAATAGRDKVVIWSPGDNGTVADWNTDPILAVVEEATNTEIEMLKIGWDTYEEQINAAIAGGTLPDIIGIIDHNAKTQIQRWVDDGVIAAYEGDIAAAAPNVIAEYEANSTLAEIKFNGKIYGQPISWGDSNYPNMGLFHVRQDLLDKYGMDAPNTFEQYFDYLRAGIADGLTGVLFSAANGVGAALNGFAGAYGVPILGWVKRDAGFEYAAIQPGMKDALLFFREMVAEGLVDPVSWEDIDKARDMYVAGQSASLIFNGGGHIGRIQNDMDLAGTGAKELLLPALDAGAGSRGYTAEPMFFGLSFLGAMPNNNPVAAARVINYLISPEGYKLTTLGVEGIDYTEENGEFILLEARTTRGFPTEAGDTGAHPLATTIVSWQPQEWQDWSLLYGRDAAFKEWYSSMWANQGMYQIESFGILTTSPLWTDFQATGGELQTRAFLDIVRSGSEEEAAGKFDQFVQDWLAAGGADAQAEMSETLTAIYG